MQSKLMSNSYNPYGDYNSDILSIIENEKKIHNEQNKEISKEKYTFEAICDDVMNVIMKGFDDIFHNNNVHNLFKKDRWLGTGYVLIIIYVIYFINNF